MKKLLPLFVLLLLLVIPAQQANALTAICWVVDAIGIDTKLPGCEGEPELKECKPACSDKQTCEDGVCKDKPDCTTEGCPEGQECVAESGANVCKDKKCDGQTSGPCDSPQECKYVSAVGAYACLDPDECSSNSDCDGCRACEAGGTGRKICVYKECPAGQTCDYVQNACVADPCFGVQCLQGQYCVNGQCRGNACDPACGQGYTCQNGQCVQRDLCAGVTCPKCHSCFNGACVAIPNCERPVDLCAGVTCPTGQACNPQTGGCEEPEDPCAFACGPDGDPGLCEKCRATQNIGGSGSQSKTSGPGSQQQPAFAGSSSGRQSSAEVSSRSPTRASAPPFNPLSTRISDLIYGITGVKAEEKAPTQRGFARITPATQKATQAKKADAAPQETAKTGKQPAPTPRPSALENFFKAFARLFGG